MVLKEDIATNTTAAAVAVAKKTLLRNPHPDPNITVAAAEHSSLTLTNSLGTGKLVYISREKGRGVVSTRDLSANTLVERAPLLYLTAKDAKLCENTRLYSYSFGVGEDEGGIALGFGSLYNHGTGDLSNMFYRIVQEETPQQQQQQQQEQQPSQVEQLTTITNAAAAAGAVGGGKVEDTSYPDYNLFVEFWTKRAVPKDHELLIDYQQRYGDQYPLWFKNN